MTDQNKTELDLAIEWLRGLKNKAWEPEDYGDIELVCEAAEAHSRSLNPPEEITVHIPLDMYGKEYIFRMSEPKTIKIICPQAPRDEDRERALAAIQFCISRASMKSIPDEENAIWSVGTSEQPRITIAVLKAAEKALQAKYTGEK